MNKIKLNVLAPSVSLKVGAKTINLQAASAPLPIQADWAEENPKARGYIKNKPDLVKVAENGDVVLSDIVRIKFLD